MAEFQKTQITTILGNPVYGVTPAPTAGFSLELVDSAVRALSTAMASFIAETKGIRSIVKDGETVTITFTDDTTAVWTVADGTSNFLSIGTVETLSGGESATASITGEAPYQTLNLGIPAGPAGVGAGWNVVTESAYDWSVTLSNGQWYYNSYNPCGSLTVTDGLSLGDSCAVEFVSSPATYSAPTGSWHVGDDCSGGVFTPSTYQYLITYIKQGFGLTGYVVRRSS